MSTIYLNGNYVKDNASLLNHRDSGFTTGIGIFDSMLSKNGEPIHIKEHFERIVHDSKTVIGLEFSLSFDDFEQIVQTLIQKNNLLENHARIRTTITGGIVNTPLAKAEKLTILIDAASCSAPSDTPITCAIITDYPRIKGCALENCKRLDYTRSYNARREAKNLGANDAILTNTDGNIACGATSNIFIEESGKLITPPLSDGVLAGVTRKKLIETREVKEESICIDRLKGADKIFLTSSFIGLRHIILLN